MWLVIYNLVIYIENKILNKIFLIACEGTITQAI